MKTSTMYKLIPGLLFALLCSPTTHAQNVITTVAGSNASGFSGDGGLATNAGLANASGVTLDIYGNIYIADKGNNRVRKVNATTGIITTICGTGAGGYVASGVPTSTPVFMPDGVFVDNNGNLHITQWYNDAVQVMSIDPTNPHTGSAMLSPECGNGQQGGDGDGGPGDQCRMEIPSSSWVDAGGNLYVSDYGNGKVRYVEATSHLVSTIVQLSGANPNAVCVDANYNMYIASNDNTIQVMNFISGVTTTYAGTGAAGFSGDGGLATNAMINNPGGMFIDNAGNLYFADMNNNRVRMINGTTGIITTVAGNGTFGFSGDGGLAINAKLNHPTSVWVRNGVLYIADDGNHRIRKVEHNSNIPFANNISYLHSASAGVVPKHNPANIENVTIASNTVSVFPNPSTGIFTLTTGANYSGATVEVYNVVGAKVYSTDIAATQTVINLNDQAAGVYFINIISGTDTYNQRVVISR